MTVHMTATRSIVARNPAMGHGKVQWFYREADPDVDVDPRHRTVMLDHDTWVEMGEPERLTVTLEVGDTLNGDE